MQFAEGKTALVPTSPLPAPLPILTADTVVVLGDEILGKPAHQDEAASMLRRLAGRRHEVMTGYRAHFTGRMVERVVSTGVTFRSLDPAELRAYLECGEWQGKAGAYAIQACLIQVNLAGEAQKHGVAPATLAALLASFARLAHLRCARLMVMPPLRDDPEESRPLFAALRRLRDQQAAISRPNVQLAELSMGMSHDLEVAVAEGATLVRVGTAVFGTRR